MTPNNNFFGGYAPQQQQFFQPQYQQQQSTSIMATTVQGEGGAKIYPVAAGNTMFLVDFDNGLFWLKSTDTNGMPQTFRRFKFEESIEKPQSQNNNDYVSKAEFEKWAKSIEEQFTKVLNTGVKINDTTRNNDIDGQSANIVPKI